ncbi:hypothetical protein PsorP6_011535 [Peronosclerospora sorghi]|uniref:Uncharacterized protein n=1 Tax=Peronosclerospora sorghi TaxID=230839 RepID=A0ACC0WHK6_9STRA|nr:hypothetical protein PsorP6_011535 [Peronosclerospora sorghi]
MDKESVGMEPSPTTQVSSVGAQDALQATKEPGPPNIYVVTILAATGLLACDGTGIEATSDPYVRLKCTKNPSQQTKTQQQTLTPSWRQQFYFSITPNKKQRLELIVEDSELLKSDFMGRCVIDLDLFLKRYHETVNRKGAGMDEPGIFSTTNPRRHVQMIGNGHVTSP